MSTGPLPTRLIFLSDIPSLSPGEKVRFLGCVTGYSTLSGTLTLQHAYPSVPGKTCPTAYVDVNLLLSTLKCTDTQVGEWVNGMGYVQDSSAGVDGTEGSGAGERRRGKPRQGEERVGRVQAVMLWSAGGVKLGEYEKAVEMRKKVGAGRE